MNGLYDMGANVWEWTTDTTDRSGRERHTVGGSWEGSTRANGKRDQAR